MKIQYNRNRYYDHHIGRWLQHDPLGYADGMNLYEYVRSNPVNLLDPFGLACKYLHKKNCTMMLKSAYTWDAADPVRWFSRIELAYNLISLATRVVPGVPVGTLVSVSRIHYVRATPVWTEYYRFTHYECREGEGWRIYKQRFQEYRRIGPVIIRSEDYFPFSTTMRVGSPFYRRVEKRITEEAERHIPSHGLEGLCVDEKNIWNTNRSYEFERE